ncbi:MAG: PEP/pyruvate-binding domain-containing protein [Myxococcota bacterium]
MLVPLQSADPASLGGKGAALRRLADRGFPVPRAWVVPPESFRSWLRAHGLWELAVRGEDAAVHAGLLAGTLPLPMPAARVAVRSSAAEEDGRVHSHAGQYESVLDVRDDLGAAVLRVWASYHAPRAAAYRGGPAEPGGMTVLVQEMVDPRASGVMFTVNPLSGSWRELTVEAVWGLGEPLVGGHLVPDRYLVRRPRRPVGPVRLARLAVEEEAIARQERQLVCGGEVAVEAPLARKLPRDELFELCRLGLRLEREVGGPQDVEWAQDRAGRFWVLQSRPITARGELPRGGATLWTRRFVGERWPNGATPLGWSIVAPILEHFIAYPETSARFLGGDPPLRLVRGHPYLNVTVFRHLAFKLPGMAPPRFMLDFFPPEEESSWLRRAAAPPDLRVYGSILATTLRERRWQRFRWNPFTNWRAWEAFAGELDARIAHVEAARPEDALAVGVPLVRDYVKVHITSLLFANIWYESVAPFLTPDERDRLLQPDAESVTARINRELWALGKDPSRLPAFLAAHGHRSTASWEIFAPRWAEAPDGVLRMARLVAEGPEPAAAPEPEVGDPFVRLARTYLRLREEQRYAFDRILFALKRRLVALGARWFDDPADVRFLLAGELDGALGRDELRRTVERRSSEVVDPDPPDFLKGEQALPVPASGRRHQGLGISPGVARGRTRVIRGPDEGAKLLPGEILVARATDPGWAPLFPRAGGLVLELGSALSHGAVVAREYRLPGVVNVAGATRLFPDGTEVTVDGRGGVVWVHG